MKWYDKYLKDYKPDFRKRRLVSPVPKVGGVIKDKKRYSRKQKHKGKY